jgi:hypothetical protein
MNRSEAASIDKMMHALDYERALGELLELDDTVRATIARESLPFTEVGLIGMLDGQISRKLGNMTIHLFLLLLTMDTAL